MVEDMAAEPEQAREKREQSRQDTNADRKAVCPNEQSD
jgi:hypothetical protein